MFITAVCVIFLIILSNNTLKSFIKSIRIGKGWGGGGGELAEARYKIVIRRIVKLMTLIKSAENYLILVLRQ